MAVIETKVDLLQKQVSANAKEQHEGFAMLNTKVDSMFQRADDVYAKKRNVDEKFKELMTIIKDHKDESGTWIRFAMQWAPALVTFIIGLLIYLRGG